MKIHYELFSVLTSLILLGCPPGESQEPDQFSEHLENSMPDFSGDGEQEGSSWQECQSLYMKFNVNFNQTDLIIEIPVQCNEFFFDKGDPPPDRMNQHSPSKISNPNPESEFISTEV